MNKAPALVLLFALSACGSSDLCLEAAEHASQCTGAALTIAPDVQPAQCEALLATSCEQLAQDAAAPGGKADGALCRWFGWFCPQAAQPAPSAAERTAPASPSSPAPPVVCPPAELPAAFELQETGWSVFAGSGYTSFAIRAGGRTLGEIEQNLFSWTRSFSYRDAQRRTVATAKEKGFSWGVEVEIFDCDGRKLGALKEQLHRSLFKVQTTYSVLGPRGEQLATSEKQDWITTDFALRALDGRVLATMHRPWTWAGDTWQVAIADREALDPRLYVMIGAFKTAVDKERRAAADDDDD